MIVRPRDAAQFWATSYRSAHRLFPKSVRPFVKMSIHLIELIDIEIGQTLPLTGSIDSPCFFRGFFARYIIYQLSTRRRWPALSLLWGSFTPLLRRPTIIYRSTWWRLHEEVSIYHYREVKPSLSRLKSPTSVLPFPLTRKKTLLPVSQYRSCSPLSMFSRTELLSTVCEIILWKAPCLSAVTISVERVKQKLWQRLRNSFYLSFAMNSMMEVWWYK